MSMNKTLTLAGATIALGVLTTVGLNLVAPISLAEAAPEPPISVEEVFGGSVTDKPSDLSLSTTAATLEVAQSSADLATTNDVPPSSGSVAPAPASVSAGGATSGGSCSTTVAAEGGPQVVVGAAAGADTEADTMDTEVAEAYVEPVAADEAPAPAMESPAYVPPPAAEVPPVAAPPAEVETAGAAAQAPVSGGGTCGPGISHGADPVVVTADGMPGDAGATPEAVADSSPTPPEVPEEVASIPEPAPEPAAVEPAPKPVAAAPPAPKRTAPPKTSKPKAPPPEVKTAWWPDKTAGKLNLTYAGDASFTKAIVLLFDGTFDSADSANQNVMVKTTKGETVPGQWLVATNRQMLLFNVDPGLYTVEIGGGLTDKGGRTLAAASSGPVFIP